MQSFELHKTKRWNTFLNKDKTKKKKKKQTIHHVYLQVEKINYSIIK